MIACAYIRVSSQEQSNAGTPEIQREKIQAYAKSKGLQIIKTYEDHVTGKTPLDKRAAGKKLMGDAEHKLFQVLIVASFDRLGRTALDALKAVEALTALGIDLISVNENVDMTTAAGKLAFTMYAGFAEFERAQIIRRVVDGRDRNVISGRFPASVIPFGYCVKDHKLEIDKVTGPLARQIFENIANGSTLLKEVQRLIAEEIPCIMQFTHKALQRTHWSTSRLSSMIHSSTYYGLYVFKSSRQEITIQVPPIVSKEVWLKANNQLTKNLHRRQSRRFHLLKGIIKCGNCGSTYLAGTNLSRTKAGTKIVYYYKCSRQFTCTSPIPEQRCKAASIPADEYEQMIWQGVKAIILNPDEALSMAQISLRLKRRKAQGQQKLLAGLQIELQAKEKERERVRVLTIKGVISMEEGERELSRIRKEALEIEHKIQEIQDYRGLVDARQEQITEARNLLLMAQTEIRDIEEKHDRLRMQALIAAMVPEIVCLTEGEGRKKTFKLRVRFRLGSQTAIEALNSPVTPTNTENGIYIHENLDLEQLAADRAYEFAYIFSPLRLKGATGSPGNPIAVV